LTRRRFLKLLSAAVGSAGVMNAMTAWGLLETSAQDAPPNLQGSGNGARVIVVGAGPGGSAIAYELMRLGYEVTVLEAQSHVGGHTITVRKGTRSHEYGGEEQVCDWDDGLWFDAGPSRFPFYHRGFWHYTKEFGIPLNDYKNIEDNAWVYAENIPGALNGQKMRLHRMLADMAGYTSELLAKATDQSALDQQLSDEDRERLLAYLVSWGMVQPSGLDYRGSDRLGFSELPGVGSAGIEEEPFPFADLLPYAQSVVFAQAGYLSAVPTYDWQSTLVHPANGSQQLFDEGFVPALGDRVKLNAPVTEIRQDETGVRVVYQDGAPDKTAELTADYCICNVPLSVLIRMKTDFSSDMREAIQNVPYAMAIRMGMAFKRRFWEEDDWIYGGQSFFNVPEINIISYPNHHYQSQNGVLLGLYAFDEHAASVSRLSLQERTELALTYGSKLHPTYREDFESSFSVAWHRMPYELGAWPNYTDFSRAQYYPRLLEPDGRIYLVGEHLSYVNGWMEGAFQSAWYQLEKLHTRVMQSG
jgi:monoamine oxidase